MVCHVVCKAGQTGGVGPTAAARAEVSAVAIEGKMGSAEVRLLSELVAIDVVPSVTWLASYLHNAEIDFINAQVDTCGAKLVWISQTATRCTAAATNSGVDLSFVYDKVAALSARIIAGSDVFGRDHNGGFNPQVQRNQCAVDDAL